MISLASRLPVVLCTTLFTWCWRHWKSQDGAVLATANRGRLEKYCSGPLGNFPPPNCLRAILQLQTYYSIVLLVFVDSQQRFQTIQVGDFRRASSWLGIYRICSRQGGQREKLYKSWQVALWKSTNDPICHLDLEMLFFKQSIWKLNQTNSRNIHLSTDLSNLG